MGPNKDGQALTSQRIFDTIARHLFAQGEQAGAWTSDRGSFECLYRAQNSTMCAVGCLIPDDQYDPEMEGAGIDILLAPCENGELPFPQLAWMMPFGGLLNQMQNLHDSPHNWTSTARMRMALRTLAENNGLDASVVDTLSFADR